MSHSDRLARGAPCKGLIQRDKTLHHRARRALPDNRIAYCPGLNPPRFQRDCHMLRKPVPGEFPQSLLPIISVIMCVGI